MLNSMQLHREENTMEFQLRTNYNKSVFVLAFQHLAHTFDVLRSGENVFSNIPHVF